MFFSLRLRWRILFQGRPLLCLQNKGGSPPILASVCGPWGRLQLECSVGLEWMRKWSVWRRLLWSEVHHWHDPIHQPPPWQPTVALANAPTRCYPHRAVCGGMHPTRGHWIPDHCFCCFGFFYSLVSPPPAPPAIPLFVIPVCHPVNQLLKKFGFNSVKKIYIYFCSRWDASFAWTLTPLFWKYIFTLELVARVVLMSPNAGLQFSLELCNSLWWTSKNVSTAQRVRREARWRTSGCLDIFPGSDRLSEWQFLSVQRPF